MKIYFKHATTQAEIFSIKTSLPPTRALSFASTEARMAHVVEGAKERGAAPPGGAGAARALAARPDEGARGLRGLQEAAVVLVRVGRGGGAGARYHGVAAHVLPLRVGRLVVVAPGLHELLLEGELAAAHLQAGRAPISEAACVCG